MQIDAIRHWTRKPRAMFHDLCCRAHTWTRGITEKPAETVMRTLRTSIIGTDMKLIAPRQVRMRSKLELVDHRERSGMRRANNSWLTIGAPPIDRDCNRGISMLPPERGKCGVSLDRAVGQRHGRARPEVQNRCRSHASPAVSTSRTHPESVQPGRNQGQPVQRSSIPRLKCSRRQSTSRCINPQSLPPIPNE
jgi:hypothetical protein